MKQTLPALLLSIFVFTAATAQTSGSNAITTVTDNNVIILPDSTRELIERLQHIPNIEVGKGVTFRPKHNRF